jgi:hypothetical protein
LAAHPTTFGVQSPSLNRPERNVKHGSSLIPSVEVTISDWVELRFQWELIKPDGIDFEFTPRSASLSVRATDNSAVVDEIPVRHHRGS